ncbi:MAG: succinylglutamate desuccinylase/aspartoacylase family protein [Acidimicrobiales bacterium]|jgi:predicted deacylase
MKTSIIRVDGANGLVGSQVPLLVYGDPASGPTVSLMAGVHGCEYTSILGLRRFLKGLDESALHGCLRVVPMANIASFHARSAFVVPHDGLNLNRCFPGRADGSFTERLAKGIFDELIAPAQYHIDMHAGDQVEDLEPFTIYDVSSVQSESRAIASAYGLGYMIRTERSSSPIAGTSSTAAAEIGVAAFTAEAGGRGLVDEHSVQLHEEGVQRVLAKLGVLEHDFAPAPEPVEFNHWTWLRAQTAGWWSPSVAVGSDVERGQRLGTVETLDGASLEEVTAPEAGVPLFLTSSPAVAQDGLLLGLASS